MFTCLQKYNIGRFPSYNIWTPTNLSGVRNNFFSGVENKIVTIGGQEKGLSESTQHCIVNIM